MPKPRKIYQSTIDAVKANIERITLYLGYGATGQARKDYLTAKAKETGLPSISSLIHKLIVEKYPDFPKTRE